MKKDDGKITDEEFRAFLSANDKERWEILLIHSRKKRKTVNAKNNEENGESNDSADA